MSCLHDPHTGPHPSAQPVYAAAAFWQDPCLLDEYSPKAGCPSSTSRRRPRRARRAACLSLRTIGAFGALTECEVAGRFPGAITARRLARGLAQRPPVYLGDEDGTAGSRKVQRDAGQASPGPRPRLVATTSQHSSSGEVEELDRRACNSGQVAYAAARRELPRRPASGCRSLFTESVGLRRTGRRPTAGSSAPNCGPLLGEFSGRSHIADPAHRLRSHLSEPLSLRDPRPQSRLHTTAQLEQIGCATPSAVP